MNTQSIRQRFWDGQDKSIKDDLTMLKGNHLFGFGGSYQRNFDYHSRTDNGPASTTSQLPLHQFRLQLDVARQIHPDLGAVFQLLQLGDALRRSSRHAELHPGHVYARAAQSVSAADRHSGDRQVHHPQLQHLLQRHVAREAAASP